MAPITLNDAEIRYLCGRVVRHVSCASGSSLGSLWGRLRCRIPLLTLLEVRAADVFHVEEHVFVVVEVAPSVEMKP